MLSAETKSGIASEVAKYPHPRTALLPALKLAQQQLGWLPTPVIAEVADLVGVSHASAQELARTKVPQPSFYLLRPDGHVGLCGAQLDVDAVKRYLAERVHLKVQGAGTTPQQSNSTISSTRGLTLAA